MQNCQTDFRRVIICMAALSLIALSISNVRGQQTTNLDSAWPGFRGPDQNGNSPTAKPPTSWTATQNIAWKQAIPGNGSSSPVVINNRVYITSAIPSDPNAEKPLSTSELIEKFDSNGNGKLERDEQRAARQFRQSQRDLLLQKQKFSVLCYDRSSGDLIWKKTATEATPHEAHHPDHGFASSSPVTDGECLFINFGSYGLYCYDLEGNLRWSRKDLGKMTTRGSFGEGSSVAVHEDLVIMPWDHEGQSRIQAFDRNTGETVWKTTRDEPTNWATPRIAQVEDRTQVIQPGQNFSRGYDFQTGREVWKAAGLSQRPVSCPVVLDGVGFFASSRGGSVLQAIPLNQTGDIGGTGIKWSINQKTPDVPSLLLSENRLYFLDGNRSILTCVNAETGTQLFKPQRLPLEGVYSSPVGANGNIFVTGRDGRTIVIRDAVTFTIVANNDIGEPVDATLALVDEEIFIRGRDHLFCIRNR